MPGKHERCIWIPERTTQNTENFWGTMTLQCIYIVGKMYSLDQIRSVIPNLKPVGSRQSKLGLLHVYNERGTNIFWLGGPLKGENTNLFMFLGEQKKKEKAREQFREVLSIAAAAVFSQGYDLFFEDDWDLRYLNAGNVRKKTG